MKPTEIKHYQGLEEVRQITRNSLNAIGELRIYEIVYASLNQMFKAEEATEIRQQIVKNQIQVFELTNSAYKDKILNVPGFDQVMNIRYIDPRTIHYNSEIIIYNDVVAFYTYGADASGTEIYNADFAQTQKQIFDQLWRKASRPVIGPGGRSSLI